MPNWVTNIVEINGPEKILDEIENLLKSDRSEFDFNKLIPMPESLNMASGSVTEHAIMAYLTDNGKLELNDEIRRKAKHYGISNMFSDDNEWIQRIYDRVKESDASELICINSNLLDKEHRDISQYEAGKIYCDNVDKYGYSTWYDWCCDKWGTKWNACDINKTRNSKTSLEYYFNTAWACPIPIFYDLFEKYHKNKSLSIKVRYADEDWGSNTGMLFYENGIIGQVDAEDMNTKEAQEFSAEILGIDLDCEDIIFSQKDQCYHYNFEE